MVSFFLILQVLYIHSFYVEGENYKTAQYIQGVVNSGMCASAVPMFFCISGFLFFLGVNNVNDIFKKMRRRVKTLVVPYVLWNLIFVMWYVVLALLPSVSSYVNSDILGRISVSNIGDTFFFLFIEPAGFHLWFLRDLIVFVAFTPIIYLLLRHVKWFLLLILAIATFKASFFNGLLFFTLGGVFSMRLSIESADYYCRMFFIPALVGWLFFSALLPCYPFLARHILFCQICGLVAIWKLSDFVITTRFSLQMDKWHIYQYTFFIYVFHEPFFNIVKKLMLRMVGESDISLTILFLLNPILTIILILCIAHVMQRFSPRIYHVLTGDR